MDRRSFIRGAGALSFLGGAGLLSGLAAPGALAANTSGYKALVCVFLKGGMDGFDTVLPYDVPSYDELSQIRSDFLSTYPVEANGRSRDRDNLLRLNPDNTDLGGRQFALPQELSPLHAMFERGEAAIIGNVGPLIEPANREAIDRKTIRVPKRLFSHNDQQSTWMSLATEGSRAGWGGQFADAVIRSSTTQNAAFTAIATGGHDPFLAGEIARQYTVPFGGPREILYLRQRNYLGRGDGPDAARAALDKYLRAEGFDRSNLYVKDIADAAERAVQLDSDFRGFSEQGLALNTLFPTSSLGRQLQTVAETINIRQALSVSRQVFFVTIGGFDTHNSQAQSLPALHNQIAGAVTAFTDALIEMGVYNDVTLFTASDFGRTLVINGDGSDHGWGSHHFVVGGAVRGKRIYGDMPGFEFLGQEYTSKSGRVIPGVSVDQYAATLGKWFGLNTGELAEIFPNLPNFNTADLGFMG